MISREERFIHIQKRQREKGFRDHASSHGQKTHLFHLNTRRLQEMKLLFHVILRWRCQPDAITWTIIQLKNGLYQFSFGWRTPQLKAGDLSRQISCSETSYPVVAFLLRQAQGSDLFQVMHWSEAFSYTCRIWIYHSRCLFFSLEAYKRSRQEWAISSRKPGLKLAKS